MARLDAKVREPGEQRRFNGNHMGFLALKGDHVYYHPPAGAPVWIGLREHHEPGSDAEREWLAGLWENV